MIRPNRTKAKLQKGETVFGVISSSPNPSLAELVGLAGFDFYLLDAEHGAVTPAEASNAIRACELASTTPLVRVGSKDPKVVLQYMDAGMMGVMMPNLMNVAEVKMLVDAVKYPPLGKRGLSGNRANDYLLTNVTASDYVRASNAQTLVIPQFEHPELLTPLRDMLNIAGVDVLMFGPRDLSLNMGFSDGPNHPEVQNVINEALNIIKHTNVAAGITAFTREAAQKEIARGAKFILTTLSSIVSSGAKNFLP